MSIIAAIERQIAYLEDDFMETHDREAAGAILGKLRELDQLLKEEKQRQRVG